MLLTHDADEKARREEPEPPVRRQVEASDDRFNDLTKAGTPSSPTAPLSA